MGIKALAAQDWGPECGSPESTWSWCGSACLSPQHCGGKFWGDRRIPRRLLPGPLACGVCATAHKGPCVKMEGEDWHRVVFWPPYVLCGTGCLNVRTHVDTLCTNISVYFLRWYKMSVFFPLPFVCLSVCVHHVYKRSTSGGWLVLGIVCANKIMLREVPVG